jgi:hypothetical protein
MTDDIDVLRVTVGSDQRVRIGERPRGFPAPKREISLDLSTPLKHQTITVLVDMARSNHLRNAEDYSLLGSYLYSVLFANEIGDALHDALENPAITLMRVVLEFEEGRHELAAWPWEYLFRPAGSQDRRSGYFLHRRTKLVLIRNLPIESSLQVTVEAPPVRVLFIASEPQGMQLSYESVLETLENLAESETNMTDLQVIRPTAIDPDEKIEVSAATYGKFLQTARNFEPHMIHIVAHGQVEPDGTGSIAFMDASRKVNWVPETELAQALMDIPSLRFVLLEACSSAEPSYDRLHSHHAAVSGVAMRLAHAGIPAVVGMQYAINQGDANVFASGLYNALIDRETVDVAVLRGRQALDVREWDRPRHEGESDRNRRPGFGLPVLYMSVSDSGALFPPPTSEGGALQDHGGPGSSAPRMPTGGPRQVHEPPTLEACARCGLECDEDDRLCDRCGNYLKCPKCGWPVTRLRKTCGQCGTSLSRDDVDLDPKTAVRRPPPAVQDPGWSQSAPRAASG